MKYLLKILFLTKLLFVFSLTLPHPAFSVILSEKNEKKSEPLSAKYSAKIVTLPAPTLPPINNPHPPQTEQDKKRVSIALEIIDLLLKENREKPFDTHNRPPYTPQTKFNLTLDQIKNRTSPQEEAKNLEVIKLYDYTRQIYRDFGLVQEVHHAHVVPALQHKTQKKNPSQASPKLETGEFMVHTYAKFHKSRDWHMLNVILAEDDQGRIYFKSFYIIRPTQRVLHKPC